MDYIENDREVLDNPQENEKTKYRDKHKEILSYFHDVVFGIVGVLLVFMLLFRVVIVSGPSMDKTLNNADTLILLSSSVYRQPKYGDIVVVSKEAFKDGEPIIKRVIATEGQTVDIDFVSGIVSVDGVPLDEPYTNTPTNLFEGVNFPLTVDKGCIFVLGDNRNSSKDSRHPEIGLIDCRQVVGKAIFLLFPGADVNTGERDFSRIGALW